MKRNNKTLLFVLPIFIVLCAFCSLSVSACNTKDDARFNIVVTIFPEYDWVKNITEGSDVNVTLLCDSGTDLHSFQPTVEDMATVLSADLFVYTGGESDEWVDDVMKKSKNAPASLSLMSAIRTFLKEEQAGVNDEEEEEDEEEIEYDEHIWLSFKNATACCRAINEKLSELDKNNADLYKKNTDEYIEKLNALDKQYADTVATAKYDTVIFGDRFPFLYLFEDYGLKHFAAFKGCSAETEASFETVIFLAQKADELHLTHIMKIEGSNHRIAETINENAQADLTVLTIDSMQSTTAEKIKNGTTYLSVAQHNLSVLQTALN